MTTSRHLSQGAVFCRRGFSLVEILSVIVIISIMVGIVGGISYGISHAVNNG